MAWKSYDILIFLITPPPPKVSWCATKHAKGKYNFTWGYVGKCLKNFSILQGP